MKVVVIGVTGRIGKRVARRLRERGHEVIGINRRAERATAVLAGLGVRWVRGDTADAAALVPALRGADAVVLTTAPTREDPEAYMRHNQATIAAVRQAGVPRLIALSHYKALRAPDGRPMLEAEPPHPYFHRIEAVHAAEAQLFRAERELDWLLVAPPAELYPYGETTGRYRVGGDTLLVSDPASIAYQETSKLSMEDLAHFIVGELETPHHHRELVTVAY